MLDVTDNILCFGKDGFSLEFSFPFTSYARTLWGETSSAKCMKKSRGRENDFENFMEGGMSAKNWKLVKYARTQINYAQLYK